MTVSDPEINLHSLYKNLGSGCNLGQLAVHQTLGGGVLGSIPVCGVICCVLEQVRFPQLNVYSVHMFLNSRNKSSTKLMFIVEI